MVLRPDWHAYLKSLGAEVEVQAQRVRQLIGDRHWLSDGHHKEYLLRELLRRHLPTSIDVNRGFVLDTTAELPASREQDLLIVDSFSYAPLFSTADLLVTDRKAVLACVAVKSTLGRRELQDVIDTLLSVPSPQLTNVPHPWVGGYFFAAGSGLAPSDAYAVLATLCHGLEGPIASDGIIGTFACAEGPLFVIRRSEGTRTVIRGYTSPFATAFFLAFLIDRVARIRSNEASHIGELTEALEAEPLDPPELLVEPFAVTSKA